MNLENIKKISWFGGSWSLGTELEKASTQGLAIDQDQFRRENRFSYLVSKYFGCQENNLAEPGISSENITRKLVSYVKNSYIDATQELLIVIWPSPWRYFWIDHKGQEQDLRYNSNNWWFKQVDTFHFRNYNLQRTIWSLHNFCQANSINYVMINGEAGIEPDQIQAPFDTDEISGYNWLTSGQDDMTKWLDFDLTQGYPSPKEKHRYFWPCESHPNLTGHAKIANEIIKHLEQLSITTVEETNDKSYCME
jgi:hypothetical protein